MSEFKIIPQAPGYKLNKEGEVRRLNDTTLMIIGGKVILKNESGSMEQFSVANLVNQLFGDVESKPNEQTTNATEENDTNESEDHALMQDSAKENTEQATNQPHSQGEKETKAKRGRPTKIKDSNAPVKVKGKRGRPAKPKDPNSPVKVKGKRGRPKGSKNKQK